MYQLVALFKTPADLDAFDRAYRETHVPLARRIPGLVSLEVSRILPARDGASHYYQMSILSFADKDAFKAAMKSPENAQAGENLRTFAEGLVEFHTAEKLALS